MSDLHSINEAINKRAGRKLIPSILVSLGLLVVIFGTLAYLTPAFALFVGGAVLLALRELVTAFHARGIEVRFLHLGIADAVVLASAWFAGLPGLSVSIVVAMVVLLFLQLLKGVEGFVKNATATTFALLYPGFVAGFIFLLARSGDGFAYITTLVIIVACNDTFAYITGVLIGKHPLAPKISPKKSWEGFFGGLIFAAIGSSLAFYYLLDRHPIIGAVAGLLGVLAATVGDLIESAIKRDLSLKDMGNLLPGHGGMLDRLDSVLITAPVIWCAIELLKRFA
ncbi:MAG: phosphatidate cytidylyltransferase [Actinobacteria bacterium]|jgi:phosphatidate cytidylyltransferase|nr:phosphatidate cytidylyltransferase [Actinomycetota bacterium]NCZ73428.1 phosphatidate cytidylyltransferase [Actinomycetota bacterium]NDB31157.1 phosphatidate cytidylyltransferase [Actinomycetota bacterium]NDE50878.1 phosphatidate cytidylyltransferase [Actinomycetota bacterium]NDF42277.1 phosphatidate cytidylyltransferase [Actinomycetota bacterium]